MGGIILGALGGAGEALVSAGAKEQASQSAQELENLRASLEEQKEQRINAYKDQGATQAQGFLKTASSTQVPQEAAPVTSLSGDDPGLVHKTRMIGLPDGGFTYDITDPDARGFTGDPVAMRKTLNSWADSADKTAALAQLDRQIAGETATNQGIVAGKMRDRSSTESVDAAYDEAMKAGDVKAATAIKALQSDKFTKVGANEMVLDRHGRVVIANTAGAELAAAHDASSERRANTRADAMESAAQIRADASMANMQARIDGQTGHLNKDQKSAWIQQIDRLKAMGKSDEEALDYMGESKHKSDEALILTTAANLQANGLRPPKGSNIDPVVFAVQQAKLALDTARGGAAATKTSAANPLPSSMAPVGGKLIGTSPDGKSVYKMPDGSNQVAQ